jgi:hypothetical protein
MGVVMQTQGEFGHRASHDPAAGHVTQWSESISEDDSSKYGRPRRALSPALLAVLMTGCFGGILLSVSAFLFVDYQKFSHLQQVGIRTDARVTGYHDDIFCRHTCIQYADFTFGQRPEMGLQPVKSEAPFLGIHHDADYRESQVQHTVPIVYDPDNPTQCALNYRDEIFTVDHRRFMISAVQDVAKFMVGTLIIAALVVLLAQLSGSRRRQISDF